ncbi:MAG: substrate-binding domain-containing protein [Christensenellales bacterium]|jgi:ribose transport system substrate-binding protein
MKKLTKVLSLVLAVVMLLAFAAGCQQGEAPAADKSEAPAADKSEAPAADESEAPDTDEPATPPAAGGDSSESVKIADFKAEHGEIGSYEPAGTEYSIAFIVKTLNNPYFIQMEDGLKQAVAAYAEKGITINYSYQGPEKETDSEKLVQMFENAVTQKVQAILVTPSDSQAIVPAVKKANEAGIPVITIDSQVDYDLLEKEGAFVTTWIGSNNFDGGVVAGQAMGEHFKDEEGPVQIAVLEGIAGHETAENRKNGFSEGLSAYANCEIVATQPADWEQEKGYNVFQNILTANPEIKGVFGSNDMMASGAIQAIAAANKQDDILVIGFDASETGIECIQDGTMYGSVAQYPDEMAMVAVDIALQIIDGSSVVFPGIIYTTVELKTKDML